MVEILRKSLGLKVKCIYCGSVLKFQWEDMKYLNKEDIEYKWSPQYADITRYIECPVCHEKVFVRDDTCGWIDGVEGIYEGTNEEKNND